MEDCQVRSCFRPVTPDDLPVISVVPNFENVFVNTGHSSKGSSYAFGSAKVLSEVMSGSKDYEDYSIQRYYLI